MTPLEILNQLRTAVIARHADAPEFDPVMGYLMTVEHWLCRINQCHPNTFYVPLKCECGAEATRFKSASQDHGSLVGYTPTCDKHDDWDCSYCIKCLEPQWAEGDQCRCQQKSNRDTPPI